MPRQCGSAIQGSSGRPAPYRPPAPGFASRRSATEVSLLRDYSRSSAMLAHQLPRAGAGHSQSFLTTPPCHAFILIEFKENNFGGIKKAGAGTAFGNATGDKEAGAIFKGEQSFIKPARKIGGQARYRANKRQADLPAMGIAGQD